MGGKVLFILLKKCGKTLAGLALSSAGCLKPDRQEGNRDNKTPKI